MATVTVDKRMAKAVEYCFCADKPRRRLIACMLGIPLDCLVALRSWQLVSTDNPDTYITYTKA